MVRRALRHGGGRLDVLPAARGVRGRGLGRSDAARLHDARQGVRVDDAASGEGGDDPGGSPRRDADRRARTCRPAAARVARRDLPPLPRGARAAAARRQARRDPVPAPVLRRLQGGVARLSRVGARAARQRRDARRVPSPLVARRREPRGVARVPRADRRVVRHRRRAALRHGEEPRADDPRGHVGDGVRPLPRSESRDVEQARRQRGRAVRLSLQRRRARRNGSSRCASSPRSRSERSRSSTTTARPRIRKIRSAGSRRRRQMRSSCAGCSTSTGSPKVRPCTSSP